MNAALEPWMEAANRKIAEDGSDITIDRFSTMAEYLAQHDSTLINYLRSNFGEVFFVSKERRYIKAVEGITKQLRRSRN
jgi:hypothetical protein